MLDDTINAKMATASNEMWNSQLRLLSVSPKRRRKKNRGSTNDSNPPPSAPMKP